MVRVFSTNTIFNHIHFRVRIKAPYFVIVENTSKPEKP